MRDAGLRRRDRGDLSRIQMNAMAEHGVRGEKSTFFVDIGVIPRAYVKVMHLFELFAVFGQVCLQIGFEPRSKLGRAAHHFFRASDGETRTEGVIEPALFGSMPFTTKALALHQ